METHESYGLMGFVKRQSSIGHLFGSPLKHNSSVSMVLYQARKERKDNGDRYFPITYTPLVEVEMSNVQFAEMITTMNEGCGIPVTIRARSGKRMEDPPFDSVVDTAKEEFKESINKLESKEKKDQRAKALDILRGRKAITREERQFLFRAICEDQNVKPDLEYAQECFDKTIEQTVASAKADIDAFYTSMVNTVGLQALGDIGCINKPTLEIGDGKEING